MTALPRIGAPYAYPSRPPESYDCWTLIKAARAALGLSTPLSVAEEGYTPQTFCKAVEAELDGGTWRAVRQPQDGDLVLFHAEHVGVWIQSRVMHAAPGVGVQVAAWAAVRRRYPKTLVLRA